MGTTTGTPLAALERMSDSDGPLESSEAWAILADASRQLGFDYFCAFVWMPIPASRPALYWLGNLDPTWQRQYAKEFASTDPIVDQCRQSGRPIVWSDALFPNTMALRRESIERGLRHGWSMGVRDELGVRGMLSLARPYPPLDPSELAASQPAMRVLAHRVHRILLDEVRKRLVGALKEQLSQREAEVLRWVADGKAAGDIAEFMDIKKTTVRFHAKNAAGKLRVANTTAAVFKALVLGLLHAPLGGDERASRPYLLSMQVPRKP